MEKNIPLKESEKPKSLRKEKKRKKRRSLKLKHLRSILRNV